MKDHQQFAFILALATGVFAALNSKGSAVPLQHPTATFSQAIGGGSPVAEAIDGLTPSGNGWAVAQADGNTTHPETAVFETASDVGFLGGSEITFTIVQNHPSHTLGRFRLSVTTDDRSLFADGLSNGGDVTANWILLDPHTIITLSGTLLTEQGDSSILANGAIPSTDTYTILANTALTGITGVR